MKKQQVLRSLYRARASALMQQAAFDSMGGSKLQRIDYNGLLSSPVNETEYIKERIKLYMDTWVIGPIDAAIAELEHGK